MSTNQTFANGNPFTVTAGYDFNADGVTKEFKSSTVMSKNGCVYTITKPSGDQDVYAEFTWPCCSSSAWRKWVRSVSSSIRRIRAKRRLQTEGGRRSAARPGTGSYGSSEWCS